MNLPVARPLAIAFVAGNRTPRLYDREASFIYRCENLAAALALQGHDVLRCHLSQLPRTGRYDIVVLHRPRLTLSLRWQLRRWRSTGTRVLADVDDLVFASELAGSSPSVLNRRYPLPVVEAQFRDCAAALVRMDGISVSTEALFEACRDRWPEAVRPVLHLQPNAVFHSWPALAATRPEASAGPVLRYLPGTRSHDRDLALIAGPLTECLRRHPQFSLEVVGPVDLPLDLPAGRVHHRDKLPFEQFHTVFDGTWLALAPLEATPFNRCKSALKWIEAGFWGVPTLGSALPDAARRLGAGTPLAEGLDDWRHWLSLLCGQPELRHRLAAEQRARVLALPDIHAQVPGWLDFALGGKPTRAGVDR